MMHDVYILTRSSRVQSKDGAFRISPFESIRVYGLKNEILNRVQNDILVR